MVLHQSVQVISQNIAYKLIASNNKKKHILSIQWLLEKQSLPLPKLWISYCAITELFRRYSMKLFILEK